MPVAARVAVAVRVGIVVLVSLVDRPKVLDGIVALAGSAVPAWWLEPAGSVERLVGLAQDESRSAALRAGWLANQASPVEWLAEGDIPVLWLGDGIPVD